ncbi:Glycosyl transferase family 2 [Flavobacterium gillisiae]|uniref:Glycosyl transferase family 2 n=1 Tax=Flavobacterium gillisiae TaxID=150146 RepID=A0A1H4EPT0_9FLAO|nr:glycosyltransferase [Flavobacterium gillisiae]SEA87124.1 Glycosyl transferase family 2 [Flavobacterium gillisiae]
MLVNNSKYLLSIVIATKDRTMYCIEAIKSIVAIQSDNIQIAIADNSDSEEVKEFIQSINNPNIDYVYDSSPTSSIANFNRALALAKGEYVCMIGDDDGITTELLAITQWAKDNNIDAVVGSLSANYRWENTGASNTVFTKMTGSTLTITNFDCKAQYVNLEKSLQQLMKGGCTNYLDFLFPKLYHGLVKRSFFDEIKHETGHYLNGLSPDIYSAITLACKINNLVYIDYPITIPGVCAVSTSIIEGQNKSNSKKIEDIPHLKNRGEYHWSEFVPRFYCVQTIWADSGFAALKDMGRNDLIEMFNKYALYSKILIADKSLKNLLETHLTADSKINNSSYTREYLLTYVNYICFFTQQFLIRSLRRLKIIFKIGKYEEITNLPTINEAMLELDQYCERNTINNAVCHLKNLQDNSRYIKN